MSDFSFVNALKSENNKKYTENGAVSTESSGSKLYDMFALGAAYRNRTESDCVLLFKEAYIENPEYALKCLWYIRDILQGQGERRFFRICLRWLANYDKRAVLRNMATIARDGFGRFDDLYCLFGTSCEASVLQLIKEQLRVDFEAISRSDNAAVSLLGKWLPSCNCSSSTTKAYARKIASYLGVNQRAYRKMLSRLRERIHVVERLMSQNRWEEIDFQHLPSRAGLIYRNAFKRHDCIAEKYRNFALDKDAKVNAGALYPYDVVRKAIDLMNSSHSYGYYNRSVDLDDTERLMVNKYWENLTDYFQDCRSDLMVVCDTSSSMTWCDSNMVKPIDVAVSLAIYAADRAQGPFHNHYISFSREARLVEVKGVDFCDKVDRIVRADLCENTNLQSVFELVVDTAMKYNLAPEALPKTLVVCSDMEVDAYSGFDKGSEDIYMRSIRNMWNERCNGRYTMPNIVWWNVNARNNTFTDNPRAGVSFVSGCSPVLFKQIIEGITGEEIMWEALRDKRYAAIK